MRQTGVHSLDALGYLLLLAGPVALIRRRAQPVAVLVVVLAVCIAYFLRGYGYGPIFVSLVVAFLTAASRGSRWWTYPLVPLGYLALVWPLPALLGRPADLWQVFALMAWLSVLLLAAEGIRQRKAVVIARRQRADAARRDEEAQRERRASEERLAIARELHDVLAHSLSMINVQSSVALELLDKRPEQAETALTAIKNASRDALAEVHALLHTIRSGSEPTDPGEQSPVVDAEETGRRTAEPEPPPAPRAPAPSISDLDDLLQRPRTTGLTVGTRVLGTPQQLPSMIDVAAARIIQESLTNVLRHAPGAEATVTVRYTPDSVDITVDNSRPTSAPTRSGTGGGNGIIGMRERTHALGGALTAGPRPSGGFRVAARLPTRTPEPGATETASVPPAAPTETDAASGVQARSTPAAPAQAGNHAASNARLQHNPGASTEAGTIPESNAQAQQNPAAARGTNNPASPAQGRNNPASPGQAQNTAASNAQARNTPASDARSRNDAAVEATDREAAPASARLRGAAASGRTAQSGAPDAAASAAGPEAEGPQTSPTGAGTSRSAAPGTSGPSEAESRTTPGRAADTTGRPSTSAGRARH
ncbi:histidine kinase [Nocardia niwae]|uniref:histidine kinase n=1 Tax=Nocardia niwae TaxID=626084 RepID=UPI0033CDD27F